MPYNKYIKTNKANHMNNKTKLLCGTIITFGLGLPIGFSDAYSGKTTVAEATPTAQSSTSGGPKGWNANNTPVNPEDRVAPTVAPTVSAPIVGKAYDAVSYVFKGWQTARGTAVYSAEGGYVDFPLYGRGTARCYKDGRLDINGRPNDEWLTCNWDYIAEPGYFYTVTNPGAHGSAPTMIFIEKVKVSKLRGATKDSFGKVMLKPQGASGKWN